MRHGNKLDKYLYSFLISALYEVGCEGQTPVDLAPEMAQYRELYILKEQV